MPMGTSNKKTNQRPQKEGDTEDHDPPRLRREERSVRFERSSHCRAVENYRSLYSISSAQFFLRLRLHVSALTGC
jgi:hypothetical protein